MSLERKTGPKFVYDSRGFAVGPEEGPRNFRCGKCKEKVETFVVFRHYKRVKGEWVPKTQYETCEKCTPEVMVQLWPHVGETPSGGTYPCTSKLDMEVYDGHPRFVGHALRS